MPPRRGWKSCAQFGSKSRPSSCSTPSASPITGCGAIPVTSSSTGCAPEQPYSRGAPGFFKPRIPPPYLAVPGTVEATSWYDTTPLRGTLERLVDFDRINAGEMRFSVGAVNIRSGNFVYFDSTTHKIRPEHIMASGALPPGCPAIEVDGELYWDGGLVSNTPLQWVVAGDARQDTLAFQVDLWSSRGELPSDLNDVTSRQKEIQYSSRTRANTDHFKQLQCARVALANVLEKIPHEILDSEDGKLLQSVADPMSTRSCI